MFKSGSVERHPLASLLVLFLLFIACAIVFSILALVISIGVYGVETVTQGVMNGAFSLEILRIIQIISAIGMFVVATILFARTESKDWRGFLSFKIVDPILLVLTIAIMFSMSPLMEFINETNKNMVLPEALKEIEAWMRLKESEMELMTKQFLVMDSINLLLVNLLMLAIIPGLGEELLFRASLQKILGRWTGNHHAAIWIAAIIFSAIHLQFYGFSPRMFLGALFGYLLVWSGNIWLPILAHFLNNGMAVVGAYMLQQEGKPLDQAFEADPVNMPILIVSTIIFAVLIWYFHSYTIKLKENNIESSDGSRLG